MEKKNSLPQWLGGIFLVFGFVALAAQDLSPTGAVISTSGVAADFVSIASIFLMIIGGVLFYRSLKSSE